MIHSMDKLFFKPLLVPEICAMYGTGTVLGISVKVMNKTDEVLALWSLEWEETDIIHKQTDVYRCRDNLDSEKMKQGKYAPE